MHVMACNAFTRLLIYVKRVRIEMLIVTSLSKRFPPEDFNCDLHGVSNSNVSQ